MKKFLILCVIAQLVLSVGRASAAPGIFASDSEEILSRLDRSIERYDHYRGILAGSADSLRRVMEDCPDDELLAKYLELGNIHDCLSTDSAIVVYILGLRLSQQRADVKMAQQFILHRAFQCFNAGDVPAAFNDLEYVWKEGVHPDNLQLYHNFASRLYVTLGAIYKNHSIGHDPLQTGLTSAREWSRLSEPGSVQRMFADILVFWCEGKMQRMAQTARDLIGRLNESDKAYPLTCALLGEYYKDRGEPKEAIHAYAASALANLQYCHPDGVSLFRLGEMLYDTGDYSRAHRYLAAALRQSIDANEKFNLMRINSAYLDVVEDMNRQKFQKFLLVTALSVLLLVFVVVVLFMMRSKRRELERLRLTRERLARTNMAMETYITKFMTLSSDYIAGLEDYNKVCGRKIKAGQTDDLLAFIKSGKAIADAQRKFYDVFDSALFHLFPTFTEDVNRLLRPEKRITPPSSDALTTELRVAALTRLGIEDAAVIARCLGISTNTIYTYRNKLRTRAIDRATFEDDLRRIGAVEPPEKTAEPPSET